MQIPTSRTFCIMNALLRDVRNCSIQLSRMYICTCTYPSCTPHRTHTPHVHHTGHIPLTYTTQDIYPSCTPHRTHTPRVHHTGHIPLTYTTQDAYTESLQTNLAPFLSVCQMVARLKQQVLELKEELSLATGKERNDALSQEDLDW